MDGSIPLNYNNVVKDLIVKIKSAQYKASIKLNEDLLALYREIGLVISKQEGEIGWGGKVIEKLSRDLRGEFHGMKGFSPRNLRYMRDFAVAYPNFPFLQDPLAKSEEEDLTKGRVILIKT
jgi:predicted nuclease of restriction endonuclease-like (RecB) superfamily